MTARCGKWPRFKGQKLDENWKEEEEEEEDNFGGGVKRL